MVCGENEYCKSENGAPKCVRKSTGLGKLLQFYIWHSIFDTLRAWKRKNDG